MRILIENASIYSLPNKQFIEKGFVYIDKGVITSVGTGNPPPELEFADYVIDGRYSVAMPGFAIGMGDILRYVFRFEKGSIDNIISTLSSNDIEALVATNLASFALNGVTSIVTRVDIIDQKILSAIVRAASECWIRVRILIPINNIDANSVEEIIKSALKNVHDQEAINKNIITFGLYIDVKSDKNIIYVAKTFNARLYIDQDVIETIERNSNVMKDCTLIIRKSLSIEYIPIQKIVYLDPNLWHPEKGLISLDPLQLNPKSFIITMGRVIEKPLEIISTLCQYNPSNLGIGTDIIENGKPADIIVLDFSKPPTGPIPITEYNIAREITSTNYTVDTVVIGGELVVDQGLILTIGDKHIRKARSVIESIDKRAQIL
ncbi:MAG: hypothetical protein QW101_05190 [Ignisphaera sp.]|uniref:Amidohydrolase n=1 Tax=Ignisphaera aggregans TaxID=334771 RepID=A0A7J3MZW5_9CREN